MEGITSKEVQEFLNHVSAMSHEKYEMVLELRKRVALINPDVKERMMYGGIMFSLSEDLGGVFVYSKHISFEFGLGYKFEDPDHLLQGNGKFRRHLKFKSMNDRAFKEVGFYIRQMCKTTG